MYSKKDMIGAALLFLATFAVFRASPIHPVFDYADSADQFRERTPLAAAETLHVRMSVGGRLALPAAP
jgi:hypothetical protein